jgi:hypothetical protein
VTLALQWADDLTLPLRRAVTTSAGDNAPVVDLVRRTRAPRPRRGVALAVAMSALALAACEAGGDTASKERTPTTTAAPAPTTTVPQTTADVGVSAHEASPSEVAALKAAFLASHPQFARDEVEPVGAFYIAVDHGTGSQWAAGSFSVPEFGTQDQPQLFRRDAGREWSDEGDTGGLLCDIPDAVADAWGLPATDTSAGSCWEWSPAVDE